jgi:hypothetical protein
MESHSKGDTELRQRIIVGGVYRHFKEGALYKVLHLAMDSETQTEVVVYQSIATGQIWVRPSTMWFDAIPPEKQRMGQSVRFVREKWRE